MIAIEALVHSQVFVGLIDVDGGDGLGCTGLTGSDRDGNRDVVGTSEVWKSVVVEAPQEVSNVSLIKVDFSTSAML